MKAMLWSAFLLPIVQTELFKARRSGMLKVTLAIASFVPAMLGFLMFIKMHPDVAQNTLMLSKAQAISGPANWMGYIGFFAQIVSGVGLLLAGFAASWLWGREYSDRTAKDLLALPFPRELLVVGKLLVLLVWGFLLFLVSFSVMLVIGRALELPDWNTAFVIRAFALFSWATVLNVLISTATVYMASATKSYLAPIGFAVATLVLGNFVGMLGLGALYPWGLPMRVAMEITEHQHIESISYVAFTLVSLSGLLATLHGWRYTDQK